MSTNKNFGQDFGGAQGFFDFFRNNRFARFFFVVVVGAGFFFFFFGDSFASVDRINTSHIVHICEVGHHDHCSHVHAAIHHHGILHHRHHATSGHHHLRVTVA